MAAVEVLGRFLAQAIRTDHPAVVVENRPGGSGAVGGQAVQQAAPDGATLLFTASTHIMARQVMRRPPYDPITDFTAVAQFGEAPLLLVQHARLAPATLRDLIAAARREPDRWTFGVSALGSPGHLATVGFNHLAGLDLPVAVYRGTAPALTDVAAGNIQLLFDPVVALLPMVRGGQVRGIAVAGARRTPLASDIPATAEAGLPGLDIATWYGLWGPRGMPAEVSARVAEAVGAVLRDPAMTERLAALGVEPTFRAGAAFEAFTRVEQARGAELLRTARFEPE